MVKLKVKLLKDMTLGGKPIKKGQLIITSDKWAIPNNGNNCMIVGVVEEEPETISLDEKIQQVEEETEKEQWEEDYEEEIQDLRNDLFKLINSKFPDEDSATERVANWIQLYFHYYSIKDDSVEELWYYRDGIYVPNGKDDIKEHARLLFGHMYTKTRVNNTIAKVMADRTIDAKAFFDMEKENPDELPVKNGILNIKTRELTKFTPEKVFFQKINANYYPDAECPEIIKFLESSLKDRDDVKAMFEVIGTTLEKQYRLQKATMFIGAGENGKGLLVELIKSFLHPKNCSSLSLSRLSSDGFDVDSLHGKLCNIAGDISNTDLKETGRFKELCSGTDTIAAQRKYKSVLHFINYAKMIFACNELPKVYDTSVGFWRRWILFEFPHRFLKPTEYQHTKLAGEDMTNIKHADEELSEKISSQSELDGLLIMALNGLDRTFVQKEFSVTKGSDATKEFWVNKSDSVAAFCLKHITENVDEYVTKKEFRRHFSKFCKKNHINSAGNKAILIHLENEYGSTAGQEWIKAYGTPNESDYIPGHKGDYIYEGIMFNS